jgi:cation transport regulator ChaC
MSGDWVFGYGSLIYKVDFPYVDSEPAQIRGWARRFWQGSHDHRGTPDSPGRVVTLIPDPRRVCRGMAYRVASEVFEHLDHREKNGYERHGVDLELLERGETVAGTLYVAGRDNPAFLGPGQPAEMADQILAASGPSGDNLEYLLRLAAALRELGENDEHVFDLERRVRARMQ